MTHICEITVEEGTWIGVDIATLAENSARSVLTRLGGGGDGYVSSVLACSDQEISRLNNDFRNKDNPTNVLSWPYADIAPGTLPPAGTIDDPTELGDIAIAYETCVAEAEAQDKPLDDHVTHLFVHALLHLLGYDHEEEGDAQLMESLEIAILEDMGISDPYS